MKRISYALMPIGLLGLLLAAVDIQSAEPASIDINSLDKTRLFFSVEQRQEGNQSHTQASTSHQAVKPMTHKLQRKPLPPTHKNVGDVLRYTGVVHSDRGVQLLLNGLPWQSGQLAVISARLKPESALIELETIDGAVHQLLPGESIELKR